MDFGATNFLNLMKYSALNMRAAIQKDQTNDQIWLHYIRSIGRNPAYDLAALRNEEIFDKLEIVCFGNKLEDVTIYPGWYHKRHAPYLQIASKIDEPICHVNHNIHFHRMPVINPDEIYFWCKDNIWYNVSWGFLDKDEATQFVEYCQSSGLLNGNVDDILNKPLRNADFLYIPKQHVEEVQPRYLLMLQWILDFYGDHFANLYCACSIAGQLCLSLIIQDMFPDKEPLYLKSEEGFPKCSRFSTEAEEDISGSLRLLFE